MQDIQRFAMQLSSRGTLVAIDQDDDAIAAASVRLQGLPCKIKIAKSNFKNFDDVLDGLDIDKIDGIFLILVYLLINWTHRSVDFRICMMVLWI